jgi:hypothetical protein
MDGGKSALPHKDDMTAMAPSNTNAHRSKIQVFERGGLSTREGGKAR